MWGFYIMKKLSDTRMKILDFISDYTGNYGYSPSIREICQNVGLKSPSSVHMHLEKLKEDGYITRDSGKTRSIGMNIPKNSVPILGSVTAGELMLATETHLGYIPFEAPNNDSYFALCISGESMINAGILNGDYVIIRSINTARHNDIVIALIDDETTCKRLYRQNGKIMLMPENDLFSPIDGTNASIIGVVTALYRNYGH